MKKQKIKFYGLLLAASVLAAACATVPKNTAAADTDEFSLLPPDGAMYIWADIKETRPLLESISFDDLDLKKAGSVLDRSETAAAVFSGAGTERFFINLRGKYPVFQAGFSLTFNRDWKKVKSLTGNPYWFSKKFGIGLALDAQRALVSPEDPFARLPSGRTVEVPAGFNEFREGAVMSGWITDPEKTVNEFLSSLGLPIQLPAEDFFFNVVKSKDSNNRDMWELVFRVRTPSVNQARALVTIFSLARIFIINMPSGSAQDEKPGIANFLPALFKNAPQRDDDVLTLVSDAFTTRETALLFSAISVYSQ